MANADVTKNCCLGRGAPDSRCPAAVGEERTQKNLSPVFRNYSGKQAHVESWSNGEGHSYFL